MNLRRRYFEDNVCAFVVRMLSLQCAQVNTEGSRMNTATEAKPQKRAVNLRVDAKMLDEARALDINLSATLEQALTATLKAQREAKWREEHAPAMEALNEFVRKNGLWSDGMRSF
jgi:antitoxin CcdA